MWDECWIDVRYESGMNVGLVGDDCGMDVGVTWD